MSDDIKIIKHNNDIAIGRRIQKAREEKGLAQVDLGVAIDVVASQISKYESGQASCASWQLIELAKELDVSVAYLIGGVAEQDERKKQLIQKLDELPMEVVRFLYAGISNYSNKCENI